MSAQSELHNRIVGEIVKSIVVPPLTAGGDYKDVMVVLESVIAGVVLGMFKLGGDDIVLDTVLDGAKVRVQEIMARERLGPLEARGRA
jgi:hypothetical protein